MRTRPTMLPPLALGLALCAACAQEAPEIGLFEQEIIGGTATTDYEAVPLLYMEFSDGSASLCSGTLISPRVVLTAAHCLDLPEQPSTHLAYFGADATIQSDPNRIASLDVQRTYWDPEWNIEDLEAGHDIGLVLLEGAAPVTPMHYNRDELDGREGDDLHLVGWGRTEGDTDDFGKKRQVMSVIQELDSRLVKYGSSSANTCQGDSGGPNFIMQDGVEVVGSLTSFGNVGCDQYGVGTNVATYATGFIDPWVVENDPQACAADGWCVEACGNTDPDCDGSAGGGASRGDIVGGCSAGGGDGIALAFAALLLVVFRRRRR